MQKHRCPREEERNENKTPSALLVWSFHGFELIFLYDLAAAQKYFFHPSIFKPKCSMRNIRGQGQEVPTQIGSSETFLSSFHCSVLLLLSLLHLSSQLRLPEKGLQLLSLALPRSNTISSFHPKDIEEFRECKLFTKKKKS